MARHSQQHSAEALAGMLATLEDYLAAPVQLAAVGQPPPPNQPNVPKPGETIAQHAAAAGMHGGGKGGAPKKVATALGSVKYHAPIGALIIPHAHPPGEHYAQGQPGHWIPSVSEEKWIANQWKDKDKAAEAAKHAVAAGTHHWVHVGSKTYAVANGLDVHVPKDVDTNDRAAVKKAPKVIVKHGENGEHEHVTLHAGPTQGFHPMPHAEHSDQALANDWQKLPPHVPKKAVHIKGQHAAWVPSDWKVYKANKPEDQIAGKFAKDPQGNWHSVDAKGVDKTPFSNKADAEKWAKNGVLVPDEDHPAPPEDHLAPEGKDKDHEPPKVDVGGVAVTKEEIQDALQKLQANAKSTQIKGLLKGHPLENSDYHAVYKGELAQYPELKMPKGSKKAHVPEAKNAYMHHLAGKLDALAKTEAEQDAMAKAAEKAKAEAAHAQELTPHQHVMGAVPKPGAKPTDLVQIPALNQGNPTSLGTTEQEIKDAIGILQKNGSTAVKQPLQKAGNPLWVMDYHKINNDMLAAHPELKVVKGTKQAHVGQVKTSVLKYLEDKLGEFKQGGVQVSKEQAQQFADMLEKSVGGKLAAHKEKLKALGNPLGEADLLGIIKQWRDEHPNTGQDMSNKEVLLAYLKEHYGAMAAADQATGHDQAAGVDQALAGGLLKPGWSAASEGAIAAALLLAAEIGTPAYAFLSDHTPGVWVTKANFAPNTKAFYEATPDHKVSWHTTTGDTYHWLPGEVEDVVKTWVQPKPPEPAPEEAKPAPKLEDFAPKPAQKAEPKPLKQALAEAVPAKAPPPPPPALVPKEEWAKEPDFPKIDQLVLAAPWTKSLPKGSDTDTLLAKTLWFTAKLGTIRWLVTGEDGIWTTQSHPPLPGTWGAQTAAGFYKVTADHQIVHTDSQGNETGFSAAQVLEVAQKLKLPEPAAEPAGAPAAEPVKVPVGGKEVPAPAGSKVYIHKQSLAPQQTTKHVKLPDGTWKTIYEDGGISTTTDAPGILNQDKFVENGTWAPFSPGEPAAPAPEKVPEKVPVIVKDGQKIFEAPAGTSLWKFAGSAVKDPAVYSGAKVYMKYPDGTWHFATSDKPFQEKPSANSAATLDGHVLSGKLVPYGDAAKAVAEAAQLPKDETTPPDETPDAAPPLDVPVKFGDATTKTVPHGSKVYWYPNGKPLVPANEQAAATKYVKYPDGSWHTLTSAGESSSASNNYDSYIESGKFAEVGTAKEPAKATPSEKPVPLLHEGLVVGEAPAGSQLYQQPNYSGILLFVKYPDGSWHKVGPSGPSNVYGTMDPKVEQGLLTPAKLPTGADLAKAQELAPLKQLLTNGAAAKSSKSWQAVLAYQLSKGPYTYGGGNVIYESSAGSGWIASNDLTAPTGKDYYKFDPKTLAVTHVTVPNPGHPDKTEEEVPFAEVKQALQEHVQPDSVLIAGSVHKHGFWYNPKGKAYLEIIAGGGYKSYKQGTAGKAHYVWHGQDGSAKDVTVAFAEKQLEKNTEWHAQPKQLETTLPAAKKPDYATPYGEGDYQLYSSGTATGVALDSTVHVHADGSATATVNGGTLSLEGTQLLALLEGGTLLDSYGTTVVKPGVQPSQYHIWGGPAKTAADLNTLLTQLEQATGAADKSWHEATIAFFGGPGGWQKIQDSGLGKSFVQAHGITSGTAQLEVVKALLRELLGMPAQKAAKTAEPVYLKSLPPGVHSAKDIFSFTTQGHAEPKVLVTTADTYGNKSVGQAKIKQISAAFGDGKVVGTHLSGLSSADVMNWLLAWKAGDMAAVFALDAKGGKVSPAHPGAPGSPDTHKVTWAALDPAQLPASEIVPGDWTDASITMPPAEVDNYLIKVGFQHAEFLTKDQKYQVVKFHRAHSQAEVDKLTQTANDNLAAGHAPLSDPLKWTEGLAPAKAYDSFLAENTSTTGWTTKALLTFYTDKWDQLQPYAQEYSTQTGTPLANLAPSQSSATEQRAIIQKWMDAKHEQYIAEQSAPVWTQTPGAHPPQATHPIYELTKTIPLTHDVSQWYFKPAQAGKKFIAEQEHAAAELGHAWGFKTPASELINFDGKAGQAQKKLPALGDLSYGQPLGFYDSAPIPWDKLTQRQVSDIAKEHLFDWAIENNDGRASNFLRMPDGSVVGIDKGRAWADWGTWKGLAGNTEADVQSRQVSGQLYDAIRAHGIPKELADQAYIDVIKQARRMAKLSDDRERAILEKAFAHRTKWGSLSKDQVIEQALARKNALESDFSKLWGKVYAEAGWQLPEVPESKLGETPAGVPLYAGFSEPDFLEHVQANKSFGAPAFFAGPDVEYGHAIVWREYAGPTTKTPVLRGKMGARGAGLAKLVAWAKGHLAPGQTEQVAAPAPADTQTVYPSSSGLPGKAPAGAKDRGFTGEAAMYNQIIVAARHISKHAVDKQWKQGVLDELAAAKDKLAKLLTGLEAIPPDNPERIKMEPPVKLYAAYVDQVEKAKEQGTTFKNGDLPRYLEPAEKPKEEPKPVPTGVKVELASPHRPTGSITEDGELHTGTGSTSYDDSTKVYKLTLPSGEVIELFAAGTGPKLYNNGSAQGLSAGTGSALAHWGNIRFKAVHADGAASLERIRAQLQEMGLPLEEATPEDMELYYWRHLYNVLLDRKDGPHGTAYDPSSKYAKVHKAVLAGAKAHGVTGPLERGGLDPQAELAIWREAWANLTSAGQVAKFTESGGHLPHFKHYNTGAPGVAGGVPVWRRFDITQELLAQQNMPGHIFFSSSKAARAMQVALGGQAAKDFRFDHLGISVESQSNPASSGSTGFVFSNLNAENDQNVLANPAVLADTTTYGWGGDQFGDVADRLSSAYFDPAKAWQWSGMETMTPGAWTMLDDIEAIRATSESNRQEIIKALKARGITVIRGLPVAERIGTSETWSAVRARVRKHWKEHPELLDPHASPASTSTEAGAALAESGKAAAEAAKVPQWTVMPSGKVWTAGNAQIVNTSTGGYDLWNDGHLAGTYGTLEEAKAAAQEAGIGLSAQLAESTVTAAQLQAGAITATEASTALAAELEQEAKLFADSVAKKVAKQATQFSSHYYGPVTKSGYYPAGWTSSSTGYQTKFYHWPKEKTPPEPTMTTGDGYFITDFSVNLDNPVAEKFTQEQEELLETLKGEAHEH